MLVYEQRWLHVRSRFDRERREAFDPTVKGAVTVSSGKPVVVGEVRLEAQQFCADGHARFTRHVRWRGCDARPKRRRRGPVFEAHGPFLLFGIDRTSNNGACDLDVRSAFGRHIERMQRRPVRIDISAATRPHRHDRCFHRSLFPGFRLAQRIRFEYISGAIFDPKQALPKNSVIRLPVAWSTAVWFLARPPVRLPDSTAPVEQNCA